MERNQLAAEIAQEYETMGIEAANQHYRLKQQKPFEEFPALASHVAFCTLMQKYWEEIVAKLEKGPEMFETEKPEANEWGFYE